MTDWTIQYKFKRCDTINDSLVVYEAPMPIPRKGEIVWPSMKSINNLNEKIKACWRERHCKDCPFAYGSRSSEDELDCTDFIHVADIIYDVDYRTVIVYLSDNQEEDE